MATHRSSNRVTRVRRSIDLRCLAWSLGVVVVVGGLGSWWYSSRTTRTAESLRSRSVQLAEEGEWRKAADYLYQYLSIHPGDTDVRLKMADYYCQAASNQASRLRAVAVLRQTLVEVPG